MYHWIDDKAFLGKMKWLCADIVNRLVQAINREDLLEVKQHLVGSGAKNLITQNAKEPIDLDYNLEIIGSTTNDGRWIKNYVKKVFDEVLADVGWEPCEDSSSALTTKKRYFCSGNQTRFKIDLCITRKDESGSLQRLIHDKQMDRYYWNIAPESRGLENRVDWLKGNGHWQELREAYLNKKNLYLRRSDRNQHSFHVYIEAVNEIYDKYHNCLAFHAGLRLSRGYASNVDARFQVGVLEGTVLRDRDRNLASSSGRAMLTRRGLG